MNILYRNHKFINKKVNFSFKIYNLKYLICDERLLFNSNYNI